MPFGGLGFIGAKIPGSPSDHGAGPPTSIHQPDKQGRTLVDLFEYQAKELFAEYGVPVPRGKVAHTAEEARGGSRRS